MNEIGDGDLLHISIFRMPEDILLMVGLSRIKIGKRGHLRDYLIGIGMSIG